MKQVDIRTVARFFEVTEKDVVAALLEKSNQESMKFLHVEPGDKHFIQQDVFELLKEYSSMFGEWILGRDDVLGGRDNRIDIERKPVVYFLVLEGYIVYVGKSNNLVARIGQHSRDKKFDSVATMDVPQSSLDMAEYVNIREHRPDLNVDIMSDLDYFKRVVQAMVV